MLIFSFAYIRNIVKQRTCKDRGRKLWQHFVVWTCIYLIDVYRRIGAILFLLYLSCRLITTVNDMKENNHDFTISVRVCVWVMLLQSILFRENGVFFMKYYIMYSMLTIVMRHTRNSFLPARNYHSSNILYEVKQTD